MLAVILDYCIWMILLIVLNSLVHTIIDLIVIDVDLDYWRAKSTKAIVDEFLA